MIKYDWIIVHHSASPLDTTVDDIRRWHTTPRPRGNGWVDIGYHFVIEEDGSIWPGRDLRRIGAHSRGIGNTKGIGICLVGDNTVSRNKWTNEQKESFKHFIKDKLLYIMPWLRIFGHGSVSKNNTICPGLTDEQIRSIIWPLGKE